MIYFRNTYILFFILLFSSLNSFAQKQIDSLYIEAKVWSRDSNRNIVYSDWKKFPTATVENLNGFVKSKDLLDEYGGITQLKSTASGFFRTQKINNRWWVIDPIGNVFIVKAVNSIKIGTSPNNQKAFDSAFKTEDNWIGATYQLLKENGFNASGSWSDVDLIRNWNEKNKTHFVYTTQLNILSDFAKTKEKKVSNGELSILANIFDADFENFVQTKCSKLSNYKNDPNLLGHFSDNELAFQDNLIKKFSAINDKNNAAYLFLKNWMLVNKVDSLNYSKNQVEQFSAAVGNEYYKIVSACIKKYDPNHMYIGSRIHAALKDNVYFLNTMDKYVDIASINYYGFWNLSDKHKNLFSTQLSKPYFITEFYTKGQDSKMGNITGAGWLVKTQNDRGNHYQNFCLHLLNQANCVGWHWFKYQDNDPEDKLADPSNNDSNKGMVNTRYQVYNVLTDKMKQINEQVFGIIQYYKK
jgi:hypothetical protein